ncbi:MAG: crossover junction endodeoxyribonuclease RuvC [Armatimonadota bacterium]|nr:crossover junction endodeoxyribonuclease RuvC [Armatimonadota bacterium]MDR5697705.1 crossover junction endodeoxyribonuclease RuvC [Armatimonadota bacterium]
MVVVGLDPGLRVTGYGVVRASAEGSVLQEAGVIRTSGGTLQARLVQVYADVVGLLCEFRPDLVALEDVFSHTRFPQAAISMAHVRGVLCLAASVAGVPVQAIAPAAVKQAVCGNGRAPKAQVQAAVRTLLGVRGRLDSHAADALALATTVLRRRGFGGGWGTGGEVGPGPGLKAVTDR